MDRENDHLPPPFQQINIPLYFQGWPLQSSPFIYILNEGAARPDAASIYRILEYNVPITTYKG